MVHSLSSCAEAHGDERLHVSGPDALDGPGDRGRFDRHAGASGGPQPLACPLASSPLTRRGAGFLLRAYAWPAGRACLPTRWIAEWDAAGDSAIAAVTN